ncbi:MAG: metallophosphoesterase [Candidatus Daviesbacteria bacterium]
MFGFHKHDQRKKSMPLMIFRVFLSLTMFLVLALVALQAYRSFSGEDSLDIIQVLKSFKNDPKATIITLITSDASLKGLTGFVQQTGVQVPGVEKLVSPPSEDFESGLTPSGKILFKFAIVSDSHNENEYLAKALSQAGSEGARFVVGLGDWTATGTTAELESAKSVFEHSGLPYYLTAGDHDLWDSRDKGLTPDNKFNTIFGSTYQSFVDSNIRFVILFNSDNYEGMDVLQLEWLRETLEKAENSGQKVLVFAHEPLSHPTSDRVMGKDNQKLADQIAEVLAVLKSGSVTGVFAGNIHAFSQYQDTKSGLKMVTVGAVSGERNVQSPRFLLVDLYENGGYNVKDLEIK